MSFFYTHTFSGLKILHSKVRKFATKIASQQNSKNQYWEVKFTFIFLAATFDHEIMKRKGRLPLPPYKLCVKLHRVRLITLYVLSYTLGVKLHTMYVNLHIVFKIK